MSALLEVRGLSKTYSGARKIAALDDVSFDLHAGRTLGIVGPSGSGKSTLALVLARLIAPDAGHVRFDGMDWLGLRGAALRRARQKLQMVFQDPAAALHPQASVSRAITDPLRIHGLLPAADWPARVAELLALVGLPGDLAGRAVTEISGGQRQRVAIARALAVNPRLIILDEAVAALDVSVRARVLDLLVDLQQRLGLAYLFISHDLAVVKAMAHDLAVIEAGRIIETGPTIARIADPSSRLLRDLIAATPRLLRI